MVLPYLPLTLANTHMKNTKKNTEDVEGLADCFTFIFGGALAVYLSVMAVAYALDNWWLPYFPLEALGWLIGSTLVCVAIVFKLEHSPEQEDQ